jgi:isoleucyl-tRNA synthetase
LKVIAPILPFLAEEVYQKIPFKFGFSNQESIYLINNPTPFSFSLAAKRKIQFIANFFLPLRKKIFSWLEKPRKEKDIVNNSQASLFISIDEKENFNLSELKKNKNLLPVAELKIIKKKGDKIKTNKFNLIKIEKTNKKQCIRC